MFNTFQCILKFFIFSCLFSTHAFIGIAHAETALDSKEIIVEKKSNNLPDEIKLDNSNDIAQEKLTDQNILDISLALQNSIRKMAKSPIFTRVKASPTLLLDAIINQTHDSSLDTIALDQALQNYIFNNTLLRMLPSLSYEYDLKTKIVIKNAPQSKKKKNQNTQYFISIELYDSMNTLKGYWSEITPLN